MCEVRGYYDVDAFEAFALAKAVAVWASAGQRHVAALVSVFRVVSACHVVAALVSLFHVVSANHVAELVSVFHAAALVSVSLDRPTQPRAPIGPPVLDGAAGSACTLQTSTDHAAGSASVGHAPSAADAAAVAGIAAAGIAEVFCCPASSLEANPCQMKGEEVLRAPERGRLAK